MDMEKLAFHGLTPYEKAEVGGWVGVWVASDPT